MNLSTENELLGKNIRLLRTLAGLSQVRIAQLIDVDQNHISRIECGRVRPRNLTLSKLSAVFTAELGLDAPPRMLRMGDFTRILATRCPAIPVYDLERAARRLREGDGEGIEAAAYTLCPPAMDPSGVWGMMIDDDAMTSPHGGDSFRQGDTVIIDPRAEIHDGDYCLAADGKVAVFRKVTLQSSAIRLACLNERYPERALLPRNAALRIARCVFHWKRM
jgi:transcriptional regulator with XRE-family HTH domain